MDSVLTDDDFYDAIEHLLSTQYPRIWDQLEGVDDAVWEQDVQDAFRLFSQDFSDDDGKDDGLEALAEEHGIDPAEVADWIEHQSEFRQGNVRKSKVDFWAEELDDAEDVSYSLPWPDDDHEMAIRSSATVSKLKERLRSGED